MFFQDILRDAVVVDLRRKNNNSVAEHISTLIKQANTEAAYPETGFQFRTGVRVSSLPYCPILDLQNILLENNRKELVEDTVVESDFGKDFYTRIGTAVHSLYQHAMPFTPLLQGKVWGKWKCQCGISKPQFWPGQCAKCSFYPEYEEITLRSGRVSGHCDLITWNEKDGWIVWEFKTTGTKYLVNTHYKKYLPHKAHILQGMSYVQLLKQKYGIVANSLAIVYVGRDRHTDGDKIPEVQPIVLPVNDAFRKKALQWIQRANSGRHAVVESLRTGKLDGDVLAYKPCLKRDDFSGYMQAKYYGKDCCEHFTSGKCFKPELMKKEIEKWIKN